MYFYIMTGDTVLMALDVPDGMAGDAQKAVTISWDVATVVDGQAIFDRLGEGGAPIMPYGKTFWAPASGMIRDRFVTVCMVSARAAG